MITSFLQDINFFRSREFFFFSGCVLAEPWFDIPHHGSNEWLAKLSKINLAKFYEQTISYLLNHNCEIVNGVMI